MKRFFYFLCAVVLLQAVLAAPARAVNLNYLKVGDIKGGATAIGFENQIAVNSWSWGLTNAGGMPTFQDFLWTQGLDTSVVPLFLGVTNGTTFAQATLSVVNAGGGTSTNPVFFEMVFHNAQLTRLSMSGSTDATLTASLTYNQVDMRYREQDGKGGLKPWIEGSFSLKANQPATFSGDANVIQGLFLSGGAVTLAAIPLAVPEPETWGMLLAGLALVAGVSTRRSGAHRRPA